MSQQPAPSKGWTVTLAALSINLVLGVLYAWGVMKKELIGQWGWIDTQAAAPFTASTLAFAIMMIFAGRMQDKIGPRKIAILGGLMLGLGMIASGFTRNPTLIMLSFGVVGGIGIGLGYSATTPPALKWFPPARKGLIAGIVVSGIGLASVIMAPLTRLLLAKTDISTTFIILGVGTILIVCSLSFLLVDPPAGFVPAASASADLKGAGKPAPAARRDMDWPEMIRTGAFWKLWMMMVLTASAGLMIIVHITTIAKLQANLVNVTKFVVLVAIFNTSGRLIGGFFSDRLGRSRTMILFFLLQAINMFCFRFYATEGVLLFGAAFTGICYGSIFPLFPATTADFFGIRNLGVNYGCVFTAFGIAGTVGPMLAAKINVAYGNYYLAYTICAVMLLAGAALALTLKAPKAEVAPVAAAASKPELAKVD